VVFILRPGRKIAGKFHFIMKAAAPPIQGEQGIMRRFCIGDIFIVQYCAQPCALPLKGVRYSEGKGIVDIVAILFGFGDPETTAVLQGKEDKRFPAAEGLRDLYIALADVVTGSLEVCLYL